MLLIHCPHCGPRAEIEHHVSLAHEARGIAAAIVAFEHFLRDRLQVAGVVVDRTAERVLARRGKRACIGGALSQIENTLALVQLLRKFTPDYVGPQPARIHATVTLCPKGGLPFRIRELS